MPSWKERMVACPGGAEGAAALALNFSHAAHMTSLELCILLVGMDLNV
jgi:hypothetical protein